MLLVSMRVNKRALSLVGGALCVAAVVLAAGLFFRARSAQMPVNLSSDGAVVKNYTVETAEQRLAFIAQFGWEVEAEPVESREVVIPEEFDEVYLKYNDLQKAQGLDLTRYRGKAVRQYVYRVLNYPGCDEEVRLHLLCAENKVIGGDVCSMALDGFMHGFQY